jgi:hypothetical protein
MRGLYVQCEGCNPRAYRNSIFLFIILETNYAISDGFLGIFTHACIRVHTRVAHERITTMVVFVLKPYEHGNA